MSFPVLVLFVILSFALLIFGAHRWMGDPEARTERRRRATLDALSALPSTVLRIRLEELEYFDFAPGLSADPPDGTPMRDTAAAEALFDAVEAGIAPADYEGEFGAPLRAHFVALGEAEEQLGYARDARWGPWYAESGAWEPIVLHAWAHAIAKEREAP